MPMILYKQALLEQKHLSVHNWQYDEIICLMRFQTVSAGGPLHSVGALRE